MRALLVIAAFIALPAFAQDACRNRGDLDTAIAEVEVKTSSGTQGSYGTVE